MLENDMMIWSLWFEQKCGSLYKFIFRNERQNYVKCYLQLPPGWSVWLVVPTMCPHPKWLPGYGNLATISIGAKEQISAHQCIRCGERWKLPPKQGWFAQALMAFRDGLRLLAFQLLPSPCSCPKSLGWTYLDV